jgi:hypothetical protein
MLLRHDPLEISDNVIDGLADGMRLGQLLPAVPIRRKAVHIQQCAYRIGRESTAATGLDGLPVRSTQPAHLPRHGP